ncbi:hypothetical protein [Streptococcus suis]|uniref:hypothetical protein n=2 Tax=Streptococcus suis TaxID=1307 RepID=UPI000945A8CD|nr:hypothetical protein [Streptococcus suis]HEL1665506.1 hypothetical protein [Streptococcus suis]HEL1687497.1 hypothetical protein [Streptococcus suis]HEL2249176.1 hypothetical protein [Streptococcus suis]HEL2674025.1 hypothetical protein [Streptococcus suis]HEL2696757.1 hypothetical protein [Streptococcus suis]
MDLTLNSKISDLILAIGEIVTESDRKTTTVELEIPDQSFYLEITIKSKEAENDTEVKGCGGGVMDVRISLYGCDDTTYIDTDVTVEEYDFLRKLKRLSKENSSYGCQPTLDVERKEAK